MESGVRVVKITKDAVIQTASALVDENGLNQLSLKAVAEALNIKTPSLYNHIGGLDALLRDVAHNGMRNMNAQMQQAAIGTTGIAAIQAVAAAYLTCMIAHPGVYETIQWVTWHGTGETAAILEDYSALLNTLIRSCGFDPAGTDEIRNMLTGMLHGFTTLQLRHAFSEPDRVQTELCSALDVLLTGIRMKYRP